jgi:hypothetical protein
MEVRSYNHELEIANILFTKLFRNITIERKIGNSIKQIPVQCMIGNRSRIFKNLENPDRMAMYTFPLIVVTRTGIQIEPDRVANLHNEIKMQQTRSRIEYNLLTPNPVAISYTVTIISKDQGMNDLILSNFIPFFNKDLFVSCIHPKFNNLKYNCQVIMESSINEEHPEELDASQDDFVINSCNFTFKTFLFGGTDSRPAGVIISGDNGDGTLSGIISEGFLTLIDKVKLDMHAVPYLDPTLPKYETKVFEKTFISVDENKEEHTYTKTVSADVAVGDPYSYYSIDKYFSDIKENEKLAIDVDVLRWGLDVNNNFVLKDENWQTINVKEILKKNDTRE